MSRRSGPETLSFRSPYQHRLYPVIPLHTHYLIMHFAVLSRSIERTNTFRAGKAAGLFGKKLKYQNITHNKHYRQKIMGYYVDHFSLDVRSTSNLHSLTNFRARSKSRSAVSSVSRGFYTARSRQSPTQIWDLNQRIRYADQAMPHTRNSGAERSEVGLVSEQASSPLLVLSLLICETSLVNPSTSADFALFSLLRPPQIGPPPMVATARPGSGRERDLDLDENRDGMYLEYVLDA